MVITILHICIWVRSNTESCRIKKINGDFWKNDFWKHFLRAKWGQKWVEMRRCQHDFYLDIEVMTCHSSLVLPSSSSATCSAWESSLGRNHGNFFRLEVAAWLPQKNITLIPKREGSQRSEPGCWGISGACLRITRLRTLHCYQSPPTYLVSSLTPTSFKNSMVADSAFSISWMPVTVHWSWSYQPIIWSY